MATGIDQGQEGALAEGDLEGILAASDLEDLILQRFKKYYELKLLGIAGVEVTQAIQRYQSAEHLTDINDQGPDNSVRIIANKDAWVRVYVRSYFLPQGNVTGTLKVYRRSLFSWIEVANVSPEPPGSVNAPTSADYATERGSIGNTLNFVVDAGVMCGNLRFDVEVQSSSRTATRSLYIDATLRQTLRMRVVPVSYSGPDSGGNQINLPATSLTDAQTTAGWSLAVYPVQEAPNISLTAAVQLTFPLTGNPAGAGGCAQSWINLNVLVAQARTADGNLPNTFYYGLVPALVPIGFNSGCASSGVTSGRVGGQMTMAHEFGHALGYPHSPCGNVGAGDPNFPAYEPYDAANTPGASIGEYGLDIRNGTVKSPATMLDYMSYCGPKWISLFNYERAVNHPLLNPETVCHDRPWDLWNDLLLDDFFLARWPLPDPPLPDPPPWYDEIVKPIDPREAVISLIGTRDETGRIEVKSITRTVAATQIPDSRPTDLVAELLDEAGRVISSAPVMRLRSHGDCGSGCGEDAGTDILQTMVPDVGKGQRLRLTEKGEEVWRLESPERPPDPLELQAVTTKAGRVTLRWSSAKSAGPTEVWVRWRPSPRAEPRVLFVGPGSGQYRIEPGALPPGKGIFDAVIHDGFSAVASKPLAVELPTGPPSVAILHPYDRQTLESGRSIQLYGLVSDASGELLDEGSGRWLFNGDEVATGLKTHIQAPEPGEYKVTLSVDGKTGRGNAEVSVLVIDPNEREYSKS